MKFGGTSMGSAERIRNSAEICASERAKRPIVVVVSAMGDTTNTVRISRCATRLASSRCTTVLAEVFFPVDPVLRLLMSVRDGQDPDGFRNLHVSYIMTKHFQVDPPITTHTQAWNIWMLGDPADVAIARETVRLAFVAALQHLPPRQRAVLILCEVLRWQATEVAELLDTSVASVNSALQRARATLAARDVSVDTPPAVDEADAALLARYFEAFERYDMDALTSLIHEDATQSMPPYDLWLSGRDHILTWWFGPGVACRGSRVIPAVDANGTSAFGQYKPSSTSLGYEPWALQVLEISDGRIVGLTFFLETETVFPLFRCPSANTTAGV
jgi:ketosteroid isomerase-like protein